MNIRVSQVVQWCKGSVEDRLVLERRCSGISIDTRHIKKGEIFVAIKGGRFDGHDFVAQAKKKGAVAIIVGDFFQEKGPLYVKVPDTLKALGDIARGYRNLSNAYFIGVTGSDGKTTAKELIKQTLSGLYNVGGTEGNFNNNIGLPLSIFGLDEKTDICVLEMGMNSSGEIRYLSSIARPDACVITNIGRAHVGYMGGVKRIAQAKSEIFESLRGERIAVLNYDDKFFKFLSEKLQGGVVTSFGLKRGADFRGIIKSEDNFSFSFSLEGSQDVLTIRHWNTAILYSALAAMVFARKFNISSGMLNEIFSGIEFLPGRGAVYQVKGVTVIDETYNANPFSVKTVLKAFGRKAFQRKFVVLGDMEELGRFSANMHRGVGTLLSGLNMDYVITLGEKSRYISGNAEVNGRHFDDIEKLNDFLLQTLRRGDAILLKGSRSMKLDRTVEYLKESL